MTTPTPTASPAEANRPPATLPWQDAANALFETGYLYLGVAVRPKPIEPATGIIRRACELWARECYAPPGSELRQLRAQLALCRDVLEECRPLVKHRIVDLESTVPGGNVDDSILTRIEVALAGAPALATPSAEPVVPHPPAEATARMP